MVRAPSPVLFVVMGATSMLLQITFLRLLLAAFSGNELDIGITLSFWLLSVGIGSYAGKRITARYAFVLSFLLIGILSLPTALTIKSIRHIFSLLPGEAISLTGTILSTGIILLPIGLIIGIQFPLAVSYAGGENPSGRIYGLEALGAFGGGILFTLVIASRVSAPVLCLSLSLLNIMAAAHLSRRRLILLLGIFPILVFLMLQAAAPTFAWRGAQLVRTGESKMGEIAVMRTESQSSIYANGQFVFSYPDGQTEECSVHFPLTLHPEPKDILMMGGSPGAFKELLKYPIAHADFIEMDPKILEYALALLDTPDDLGAAKDPRISIAHGDGRRFIRGIQDRRYDVIILNLPQPSTASINRFYTEDFFREAKHVLRKDGILSLRTTSTAGYMGRSAQMANGAVYQSLLSVFHHVGVTSQEYGLIFSSDSEIYSDPDFLEERFLARAVPVTYFDPSIFRDAFSPYGVAYVKKRLSEIRAVNTDFRPSAYLYNLMLWAEMHGGNTFHALTRLTRWHVFGAIFILLSFSALMLYRKRAGVISLAVCTTSFGGISFVMVSILVYQSIHGHVYEMIGLLSASFMAGLWAGASFARSLPRPLAGLVFFDAVFILLALVSLLTFGETVLLYAMVCAAGIMCGGQFSAASLSFRESHAGGRLYALDLIGSFIGALITSLITIPLFGVASALFMIAGMKAFSAGMILTLKPFSNH